MTPFPMGRKPIQEPSANVGLIATPSTVIFKVRSRQSVLVDSTGWLCRVCRGPDHLAPVDVGGARPHTECNPVMRQSKVRCDT